MRNLNLKIMKDLILPIPGIQFLESLFNRYIQYIRTIFRTIFRSQVPRSHSIAESLNFLEPRISESVIQISKPPDRRVFWILGSTVAICTFSYPKFFRQSNKRFIFTETGRGIQMILVLLYFFPPQSHYITGFLVLTNEGNRIRSNNFLRRWYPLNLTNIVFSAFFTNLHHCSRPKDSIILVSSNFWMSESQKPK